MKGGFLSMLLKTLWQNRRPNRNSRPPVEQTCRAKCLYLWGDNCWVLCCLLLTVIRYGFPGGCPWTEQHWRLQRRAARASPLQKSANCFHELLISETMPLEHATATGDDVTHQC
jgi:hypothetical protein